MRPILSFAAILLSVVVSFAQRPPMKLKPGNWKGHGILLVPMSDYSGSQGLNPQLAQSVKPYQPVLFVLQNRSKHALHGYAAIWTLTDNAGKTRQTNLVNWLFDGPVSDGVDLFIGPYGVVGHGAVNAGPLAADRQLTLPQAGESVSIEVQAILLDDGTALGPGAAAIADEARAQIRAYKDLAQELAAIQSVEAAKTYLQGKVARPTRPTGPVTPIANSARLYRDHQTSLATLALNSLDRGKDIASVKAACAARAAKMPDYNIHVVPEGAAQ
jgi:hypothetical protein